MWRVRVNAWQNQVIILKAYRQDLLPAHSTEDAHRARHVTVPDGGSSFFVMTIYLAAAGGGVSRAVSYVDEL